MIIFQLKGQIYETEEVKHVGPFSNWNNVR